MLLEKFNYKIRVIAITGEPMKNKDQVEYYYWKDKIDFLLM